MSFSACIRRTKQAFQLIVTVALVAVATVAAQDTSGSLPTVNGIAATIGGDADARSVISRVFAHLFWSDSHARQRKEFLLASQVRPVWLPAIDHVEFVLLTKTQAATLASQCGSYWMVGRVERTDRVVSLRLDHRCAGSVRAYVVSFDGQEWRLGPPGTGLNGGGWVPGMGSGFAGGRPPECICP